MLAFFIILGVTLLLFLLIKKPRNGIDMRNEGYDPDCD